MLQFLLILVTAIASSHFHAVTGSNLAVVTRGDVLFASLATDGHEIIGIARLANELYVVCVSNETIFVFNDQSPYTRLRTFRVTGMSPGDIVADTQNERLYVIDWRPADQGNTRVWEVNPVTGAYNYYVNATRWTGTLSLTPRRKVLGVLGNSKLNLYDSSSGLISIQLPSSIVDPQHAVQTSRGIFYVSQGWGTGQAHRVNELDPTGTTILHQFGSDAPGNGSLQLNWPRHLAYSSCGLYVADYWNRRVLLLSSDLRFKREVLNHEKWPLFGWPNRLLYFSKSSTLYVAMAEQPPDFH